MLRFLDKIWRFLEGFLEKISTKYLAAAFGLFVVALFAGLAAFMVFNHVPVLDPKGIIAAEQKNLLIFASVLSLFVILPVYAMTALIVWKYRVGARKLSRHTADWEAHNGIEFVMWAIPFVIILILSIVTWKTSHSLDPFRPLASEKKPLTIQVVSLSWKWLFMYPEQGLATVNYVKLPVDRPVNFEITSDAPMNSFWIPQLGGQIYAMPGMNTKLHLVADKAGSYRGSSANISGEGFSGMKFVAEAISQADFDAWSKTAGKNAVKLDVAAYQQLAQPSKNNKKALYTLANDELYDKIIMKYMSPNSALKPADAEEAHDAHETGDHH